MGQRYAAYDDAGKIWAFYEENDSPVPAGVDAIEISDEQWQRCLAAPGWSVSNGVLVAPAAPTPAELAAMAAVDARAERDFLLTSTDWLVARHRDEVDAGVATSLSAEQFGQLQAYRQALREWPETAGFPQSGTKPVSPSWLS